AVVLPEAGFTPSALASTLERLLADRDWLAAGARSLHAVGRPDATARLADLVEGAGAGRIRNNPDRVIRQGSG
ncbi:MAG: UDP-N-acetylglucosamine--N-acetylmuramyl-(pentapeptide) pyrophosphoryl-undecaprenol N-acetylglucosamine transferase, partial [Alphaproteobacteria bacterium]|nr:UDP-N-acetylglucosamine--N-acetylmuramyl-(pentapeptide) pyrophosphoryl-undecaprenol N-acetylglucosamine transferase [Alphaproteobacteria bacterium]